MLIDIRSYVCKPGTIKIHLELYEKLGKIPQTRHLGDPLLYMTCESGNPNEYVHIWGYQNAADRERKRGAMWSDAEWIHYVNESKNLGALLSQSNKLMNPVNFFSKPSI